MLACLMLAWPAGSATASSHRGEPSARELWERYPLEPDADRDEGRAADSGEAGRPGPDEAGATDSDRAGASAPAEPGATDSGEAGARDRAQAPPATTPSAAATPSAREDAPAAAAAREDAPASAGNPMPLLLGLAVMGGLIALAAWLWTRRRHGRAGSTAQAAAAAPAPASPAPDPVRRWVAGVEWHHEGDVTQFRVVARTPEGHEETIIGASAPLKWPPAHQEEMRELTRAAYDLADSVVAAGWRPIAPGASWYARRFEWEPVASLESRPRTRPPAGRFAPAGDRLDASDADLGIDRTRAGHSS